MDALGTTSRQALRRTDSDCLGALPLPPLETPHAELSQLSWLGHVAVRFSPWITDTSVAAPAQRGGPASRLVDIGLLCNQRVHCGIVFLSMGKRVISHENVMRISQKNPKELNDAWRRLNDDSKTPGDEQ